MKGLRRFALVAGVVLGFALGSFGIAYAITNGLTVRHLRHLVSSGTMICSHPAVGSDSCHRV